MLLYPIKYGQGPATNQCTLSRIVDIIVRAYFAKESNLTLYSRTLILLCLRAKNLSILACWISNDKWWSRKAYEKSFHIARGASDPLDHSQASYHNIATSFNPYDANSTTSVTVACITPSVLWSCSMKSWGSLFGSDHVNTKGSKLMNFQALELPDLFECPEPGPTPI